jgi:hypothetical protein
MRGAIQDGQAALDVLLARLASSRAAGSPARRQPGPGRAMSSAEHRGHERSQAPRRGFTRSKSQSRWLGVRAELGSVQNARCAEFGEACLNAFGVGFKG